MINRWILGIPTMCCAASGPITVTAQGGFLGREQIQLFDEFRYFFVDRRQKRINAELVHASGSMFGDVLEFQKIRLR